MRRVILAIVGTVAGLIVLLSFKTHSTNAAATPPAAISGTSSQASSPAATPRASSSGSGKKSPTASSSSSSAAATAMTVTGTAADTMYGPVQVQITVRNGKVTAAQAVQYPQDSARDQEINSYAIPVLNQEAVSAGSARIERGLRCDLHLRRLRHLAAERTGQGGRVRAPPASRALSARTSSFSRTGSQDLRLTPEVQWSARSLPFDHYATEYDELLRKGNSGIRSQKGRDPP